MTQEQLKELAVGSVIESKRIWPIALSHKGLSISFRPTVKLSERWQKVVAGPTEDVWQCIRPNNGIQIIDGSRILRFRECRVLEGIELLAMIETDDAPDRWSDGDMARNMEELHLLLVLSRKDPVHQAEHVVSLIEEAQTGPKLIHFAIGLFVGAGFGAAFVTILVWLTYGIW